jgi:predicted ATP-dependent endonuclease of OLD family
VKLSNARIRDYRSIKDVTIGFSPNCRVLVGVNEAGKSNILKALRLLDPAQKSTDADKRNPLNDESYAIKPEVIFSFLLEAEDHELLHSHLLSKTLVKNASQTLYETSGSSSTLKDFVLRHTEATIWEDVGKHAKAYTGFIKQDAVKMHTGWQKRTTSLPEAAYDGQLGSQTSINAVDFVFGPDYPEINFSSGFSPLVKDDLDKILRSKLGEMAKEQQPECIYWTFNEQNLLPASINIDAFSANPDSCLPLKHMFHLAGVTDIAGVIQRERDKGRHALRNLLERVANLATKHISGIWKEWKGLTIQLEPTETEIDASVLDSVNRYNFADRSDGFKRFVSFLLIISSRLRSESLSNKLLLMDEPELGLHPSGVRYLRDELLKIAQENFVVVSTHSIFMVDKVEIARHLIVSKSKEVTSVSEVGHTNIMDEEVIFNALGYSIFASLARQNLVFEGWRDKKLFDVAILKAKTELKTGFKNVGKCFLQGLKDVGRVIPLIELGGRNYTILSDDDKPAKEAQQKFHGAGKWFRYSELLLAGSVVTAEDFISARAFKPSIGSLQSRTSTLSKLEMLDPPPTDGRIDQLRRWLEAGGISGDGVKAALNEIKSNVFENLNAGQILPTYSEYLDALLNRLSE